MASVWKGQISFGMVSFPVKLCAAARRQAIRFHQLHPCASPSRIKQVLYCRVEDKPVPRTELVKEFEYDRDRYVVVEDHELQRLAPPSSRVMEVQEFVPAAELAPLYLDASYYVAPQNGGEKPYALLLSQNLANQLESHYLSPKISKSVRGAKFQNRVQILLSAFL